MLKIAVTIFFCVFIKSDSTHIEDTVFNASTLLNRTFISAPSLLPALTMLPQKEIGLKSPRKPRFFPGISFLTGLGLGSIAGVAAFNDPNFFQTGNFNIVSKLATTTKAPSPDVNLRFSSSEHSPLVTLPHSTIYNPSYPYVLALSTNALVNQTLRAVHQTLQELKALVGKDTNNNEDKLAPVLNDEADVEDQGSNDVSIYKEKENYVAVNFTILRDLIRASIAEEIAKNSRFALKAVPIESNDTTEKPESTEEDDLTTRPSIDATSTPNVTNSTDTSSTEPSSNVYYYGQPQNISGVQLTESYSPPVQQTHPMYSSRPEVYPVSLPIFEPGSFHQDQLIDYYGPSEYPSYGPPSVSYTGTGDFYPHHDQYVRTRSFSSKKNKDLSGFIPSQILPMS